MILYLIVKEFERLVWGIWYVFVIRDDMNYWLLEKYFISCIDMKFVYDGMVLLISEFVFIFFGFVLKWNIFFYI